MDVCSKDTSLDIHFRNAYGEKNETSLQFLWRAFETSCKIIASPKRKRYIPDDLISSEYDHFVPREFEIYSSGFKLACGVWLNNNYKRSVGEKESSKHNNHCYNICIVYTHTNGRNLCDALEVLHVADVMHANVVSYDLPGSGKSEGALSGNSSDNIGILDDILSWVRKNLNPSEIILWSRGMSTAIAVEFTKISTLSKLKSNGNSSPTSVVAESNHFINDDSLLPPKNAVSFLILDSPFTSVQDIFDTAITTAKDKGRKHVVLSPVFSSLSWMLRKAVGTKMNINLDSIRPIDNAVQNNTPCAILAARNDDFIPISHSKRFAEQWSGPVMLFEMDGSHFGYRSKEYTLMLIDAMRPYLKKSDPLVYTQVEKDENPKV